MRNISPDSLIDLCPDVFGIGLEGERVARLAKEFVPILAEIRKLRELDLSNVHPTVIFDPESGYTETDND